MKMVDEEQEYEKLHSHPSNTLTNCIVYNKTERDVSIEWLNLEGDHVCYFERLKPNHRIPVQTYVGHPWVFYETDTRHPLVILPEFQRIYFPNQTQFLSYEIVNVTIPQLSLQQSCLNYVHRHLSITCGHVTKEEFESKVKELGLPVSVTQDLIKLSRIQHDKNIPVYIMPEDKK